ncbi:AAA family ATPase [Streptomyces rectiverticillatus]|uniref:AAA family ATPase n=1 Tax=Streptomyces rectiverticillatus TaxID=173860 RepID=UPI001FE5CA73|nr:AAA family ATPase [Streptomyces rectiverticillatus]
MTTTPTGTSETRLIVLRGNSGSGKTTTAQALRTHHGRGLAIVGQDYLRRGVLGERGPADATLGLVDIVTRHCLDEGYHVVLEGIFSSNRWGRVLCELAAGHQGTTAFFYFDIPFEETLRRHAARPEADSFGAEEMRDWYRPGDLLGNGIEETVIGPGSSLDATMNMVMDVTGLRMDRTLGS